ncbi:MAG: hypothetical protein ACOY3V_03025 [Pseudomonadota bacterium]
MGRLLGSLLSILFITASANAETITIERIKITDNEMSCRQIYDELGAMDKHIADAKAVQASGETTATTGQAAGVAAEVASRTGLFGQLGGLTGHLFGSLASKTAASVTEQSGQQTAKQAAETERQALARKEHLTELFSVRGCQASNPDAAAKHPDAIVAAKPGAAAAAPVSSAQALKEVGDRFTPLSGMALKGKVASSLRAYHKVIVPQFRVAFVVKTGASAHAGSGLANFGQHSGGMRTITQAQNKRVEMSLANVDRELMAGIADRMYADFIERLKASGKEVVSLDEMKQTSGYQKLKFLPGDKPYTSSPTGDPREYVFAAPAQLPLAFTSLDEPLGNAGVFDQTGAKAIHEMSASLDALTLIPTVIVDFAQLESSGRSNFGSNAEAEVTPKLGLGGGTQLQAINGKDAKIFFTGEFSVVKLDEPFFTEGDFGQMTVVDASDNAALANSLTMLTGTQGTQNFDEKRLLQADPGSYARKVLQLGATANEAFANGIR